MILVDTSVWIDYFRNGNTADALDKLIESDMICINDVILSELLPSINQRHEEELKELLLSFPKLQMKIDWNEIVFMQTENLRNGINKVGLPDLMITQNTIQNKVKLFSCDRHFQLIKNLFPLQLFE
ncbi:MAG: PIN domain-containing protein [Spirochaetaceae bacterium]|nr:PIN domain-containing protein [Spirochaetaceae bacterium]